MIQHNKYHKTSQKSQIFYKVLVITTNISYFKVKTVSLDLQIAELISIIIRFYFYYIYTLYCVSYIQQCLFYLEARTSICQYHIQSQRHSSVLYSVNQVQTFKMLCKENTDSYLPKWNIVSKQRRKMKPTFICKVHCKVLRYLQQELQQIS